MQDQEIDHKINRRKELKIYDKQLNKNIREREAKIEELNISTII